MCLLFVVRIHELNFLHGGLHDAAILFYFFKLFCCDLVWVVESSSFPGSLLSALPATEFYTKHTNFSLKIKICDFSIKCVCLICIVSKCLCIFLHTNMYV